MASNTGDSFPSASSASFLIARSGWSWDTRVSGDISISIDDCFLSAPRIVRSKVSSMQQMSIPNRYLFAPLTLSTATRFGAASAGPR
jgi:hypothetical protein